MAKPQSAQGEREAKRPPPRLYLVTPVIEDAAAFIGVLRDALAAAEVAAVLLRLKPAGERDLINRIKILAPIVQQKDTALVLDGQAEIAARAGADGAHLTGIEAFLAAIESLKPARIAGCGGMSSRDDAMLAGERGTDYVMFGEPKADGYRPSFETIIERVQWWADLFTVPCVGFAAGPHEIGPLVAAGADFVAVGDGIWNDARGAAAALAEAARQLEAPETAA
jgi:thiamine-phosphate pyrophosphorylase